MWELIRPVITSWKGQHRSHTRPSRAIQRLTELRVLVHPSAIDLSSRTLRYLTGQLAAR